MIDDEDELDRGVVVIAAALAGIEAMSDTVVVVVVGVDMLLFNKDDDLLKLLNDEKDV